MEFYIVRDDKLEHHGIDGMHWGERNGPPYPLSREKHNKVVRSSKENSGESKETRGFSFTQKLKNKKEYEKSIRVLEMNRPRTDNNVEKFKNDFNKIKENTAVLKAASELSEYKQYQKNKYDYDEYMYKRMWTNPESKRRVNTEFDGELDYETSYILDNDSKAKKMYSDMWKSRRDLYSALDELAIKYTGEPDKKKYFDYVYVDKSNKKHRVTGQYWLREFCDDDYTYNMRSPEKDMLAWNKLNY